MIRPRVADLRPVDGWQQQGMHLFVFQLQSVHESTANPIDPPLAVFAMHPSSKEPVSAVVVTATAHAREAEVLDLLKPEQSYTAPLDGYEELIDDA